MSEKQIKIKAVTSLSNVISRLEQMIESLKEKHITITSNGKALILQPQDPIRLDIEADGKGLRPGSRQQLYVRLKWQRKQDGWKYMIQIPSDHPVSDIAKKASGKLAVHPVNMEESTAPVDDISLNTGVENIPETVKKIKMRQAKPRAAKPRSAKPAQQKGKAKKSEVKTTAKPGPAPSGAR